MKLYNDFWVTIKAGKEERTIKYGCGVRQGDNLAQTLFIIVIQIIAERIEQEYIKQQVNIIEVSISSNKSGTMIRQKKKN